MEFLDVVFSIAILIMSVVAHEVSHGYAALLLGDPTAKLAGRLTLNPFRHLDPIGSVILPAGLALLGGPIFGWAKPVPFNPYNLRDGKWGPAIVGAAGPTTNILIAVLFGLAVRFAPSLGIESSAFLLIVSTIVFINLLLAIFNLIPIPPLDGSKVLFALLPYRYQGLQSTLERYGFLLLIFFIFFVWRILFPVIQTLFTLLTGLAL